MSNYKNLLVIKTKYRFSIENTIFVFDFNVGVGFFDPIKDERRGYLVLNLCFRLSQGSVLSLDRLDLYV